MTKLSSVFLILVLFAGSINVTAEEPASGTTQDGGNQVRGTAVPHEGTKVDLHFGESLGMSATQLAMWEDDPPPTKPAQPDGPVVLPPKPPAEMLPVPSGAVLSIVAGPGLPAPAASFGTALPASAVPSGAAASLAAVPAQGPNPLPAADEKTAAPKNNALPAPFNIMDPKRETEVTVVKGRSQLLRSTIEFTRTAVVDPAVCDLIQYSATEIGFIGKGLGTTEVTVWFRESNDPNVDTQPRSFVVHVVAESLGNKDPHLKQLEAEIARLFPNSKVRLRTFGKRIIVLGQARNVTEAAEILNIIRGEEIDVKGKWVNGPGQAERNDAGTNDSTGNTYGWQRQQQSSRTWGNGNQDEYSDRVVNMLKVPGVHQIMLRVKIAELDRTAARGFGANFSATIEFRNGTLLLQSLLNASNSNSIIGNFSNDQLSFGIHYLEQHGVVRLLSEPTLIDHERQAGQFHRRRRVCRADGRGRQRGRVHDDRLPRLWGHHQLHALPAR